MPAFEDRDGFVTDDLITWQYQAQNELLTKLVEMARGELNELAAVLNDLNGLLYDADAYTADAASAALVEVMRLSMMAAIHILGMIQRNPDGLTVVLTPAPSAN